jgi:60S ribosomal subunit assembly/export protein LOC1
MRARQLEEVREARREEMERRKEGRREELEGVKREVKRAGKKGKDKGNGGGGEERAGMEKKEGKNRKRVSFA